MDPRFFLPCFHGPRASRLGHKRKEKNSVHNLPYGPRTRLIRGIYFGNLGNTSLVKSFTEVQRSFQTSVATKEIISYIGMYSNLISFMFCFKIWCRIYEHSLRTEIYLYLHASSTGTQI